MQNRTFLVLFRPIFGEKLKTAHPKGNWVPKSWSRCRDSVWKNGWIFDFGRKISLNFGEDLFFFIFWRPPVFGLKKRLNFRFGPKSRPQFRWRPFFIFLRPPVFGRKKRLNFRAFREIPSQFSDKPCETDSRTMKIRVKVVCTFLTFSKKPPPPFSKSWLRACPYHYRKSVPYQRIEPVLSQKSVPYQRTIPFSKNWGVGYRTVLYCNPCRLGLQLWQKYKLNFFDWQRWKICAIFKISTENKCRSYIQVADLTYRNLFSL